MRFSQSCTEVWGSSNPLLLLFLSPWTGVRPTAQSDTLCLLLIPLLFYLLWACPPKKLLSIFYFISVSASCRSPTDIQGDGDPLRWEENQKDCKGADSFTILSSVPSRMNRISVGHSVQRRIMNRAHTGIPRRHGFPSRLSEQAIQVTNLYMEWPLSRSTSYFQAPLKRCE